MLPSKDKMTIVVGQKNSSTIIIMKQKKQKLI